MEHKTIQHIFFVDDDSAVREVVSDTLSELQVEVTCFANPEDCLKELAAGKCDLLITDVNMPKMDGLELLAKAKQVCPLLLVLVLTGFGDIPNAVRAMKLGAFDFLEKPLDENIFLPVVELALKRRYVDSPVGHVLSNREKEILQLILDGKSNKEMARLLHRSIKTIEFHRYRLMSKFDVHNLAELIRVGSGLNLE